MNTLIYYFLIGAALGVVAIGYSRSGNTNYSAWRTVSFVITALWAWPILLLLGIGVYLSYRQRSNQIAAANFEERRKEVRRKMDEADQRMKR